MDYLLVFKLSELDPPSSMKDMIRYAHAEMHTYNEEDNTLTLYRSKGWRSTKGIVDRAKSFGWTLERKA